MRSFLLQPYPFSEYASRKMVVCCGIGVFITLFLAVFEPFAFDELPEERKWKHALAFGLITFVLSSLFQIMLPKIFPSLFREAGWRSWKEIVYLLITTLFIGAGNYGLILYLYPQSAGISGLLKTELLTLQIGIFPILFIVFMKQMQLYKKFANEAREVSQDINGAEEPQALFATKESEKIILRGDNQNEELPLSPHDLYFISSADNYVNIRFCQARENKTALIRSTLKKMEDQLAGHNGFFRCHRMYIANLQLVESVSGNAQGLKLHFTGCEETVPVSRGLTKIVKQRLHQLSHSSQPASF